MAASGQEFMCGPLSVEYMTNVLSAIPASSNALSTVPTFLSWSIMASAYSPIHRPDWPRLSGLTCVRKCMCVKFTHRKIGLPAAFWRWMKSTARLATSSSIVSIRFLVSGPVSLMICLPTLPNRGSTVGSSVSLALRVQHAARAELLRGTPGLSGSPVVPVLPRR